MKTKKYRQLFGNLLAGGDIDAELYTQLNRQIDISGKMTKEIYRYFVLELERLGKLNTYATPYNTSNEASTDGAYVYMPTGFFQKVLSVFLRFVFSVFGPVAARLVYGVRVKGRENLKGVKGAVTVSNHISYADVLLLKTALRKRIFFTSAPHNNKIGLKGIALKCGGVLPIPTTLSANKNFYSALKIAAEKGWAIHFYPERAMWLDYKKPRPFKKGAFFYAAKMNVPVVPIFYCYRKKGFFRRLLGLHAPITAYVLEPVLKDETKASRCADEAMRIETELRFKTKYEEFYGEELLYLNGETLPSRQTGSF